MATTNLVTAADLEQIGDDDHRYDLIRGELHRMAPASEKHGKTAGRFAIHVGSHVLRHQLGEIYIAETGFYLAQDPDVVVAPDFAFVRTERLPPQSEERCFLRIAPDLAVEVISPSESAGHVAAKIQAYRDAGTRLLLVVRPEPRTIAVYPAGGEPFTLHEGDELDGGEVLPGFRLPVATLFA